MTSNYMYGGDASKETRKMDRKTIEKNRRMMMKDLCLKLSSLIPPDLQPLKRSKVFLSQQDLFDQAENYIKQLKERVEELKSKKRLLAMPTSNGDVTYKSITTSQMFEVVKLPILRFRDFDGSFEVVLVSNRHRKLALNKVISILEEGGAEVVAASLSNVGPNIFITVHAQVRVSRVGVDTLGVYQRLQTLIS